MIFFRRNPFGDDFALGECKKLYLCAYIIYIRNTTMKKTIRLATLAAVVMCGVTSCVNVAPNAGEEAVLIHKPYIFGPGGVDEKPVETGRTYTWISTSFVKVSMLPQKFDENLDDATSNDNTCSTSTPRYSCR